MPGKKPHKTREDMIQEILEEFDFKTCQKAMYALNWGWWGEGTPSIETMKESARQRLNNAIEGVLNRENKMSSDVAFISSSGGLKASAFKNRYGYLDFLKLEFVISEWETDDD